VGAAAATHLSERDLDLRSDWGDGVCGSIHELLYVAARGQSGSFGVWNGASIPRHARVRHVVDADEEVGSQERAWAWRCYVCSSRTTVQYSTVDAKMRIRAY
jgi:hypothetical protein